MKFRCAVLAMMLFPVLPASAQQVFYPVESQEAWQAFRSSVMWHNPYRGDLALNRYAQLNLYSRDSGDTIIEVSGEHASATAKPLLKCLFKDGRNFYKTEEKNRFVLIANPVLHFESGRDDSGMVYRNGRGAEVFGNIGGLEKGIGFYTRLTENQELFPYPYRYFRDSMNFVPGEFYYKDFKNKGAVDYFQARGYITFNAARQHVHFQFGHDKHKIGNGYRSLILSDFAPQFLFLKINTDLKRFHYQNLFAEFTDNGPVMSNVLYGKKYGAFHRLSFDIMPSFNIGLSEMVVFDRSDSNGNSGGFDVNYLNPVIFYRSVESNLGSRDNSLMALDARWIYRSKFVLYAQILLDEFNLSKIKNEPKWWGNKYALQLSARVFNLFGLKHLDMLAEYNRARPYTYSHQRPSQSYTHFNQPLAHPLGANFSEGILELRYQYKKRCTLQALLIYAATGRDSSLNGRNYGSNLLRSYDSRATENNSEMLMGKRSNLTLLDFVFSYRLRYNIYADARLNYRIMGDSRNLLFTAGIRFNASLRRFDF